MVPAVLRDKLERGLDPVAVLNVLAHPGQSASNWWTTDCAVNLATLLNVSSAQVGAEEAEMKAPADICAVGMLLMAVLVCSAQDYDGLLQSLLDVQPHLDQALCELGTRAWDAPSPSRAAGTEADRVIQTLPYLIPVPNLPFGLTLAITPLLKQVCSANSSSMLHSRLDKGGAGECVLLGLVRAQSRAARSSQPALLIEHVAHKGTLEATLQDRLQTRECKALKRVR